MRFARLKHGFYPEHGGFGIYDTGRKLAWISEDAYRHIKETIEGVTTMEEVVAFAVQRAGPFVTREHWGSSKLHTEEP